MYTGKPFSILYQQTIIVIYLTRIVAHLRSVWVERNMHACGHFKCYNLEISFKACRSLYQGNTSKVGQKISDLQPMFLRKKRELYSLKYEYSTCRCPVASPPTG